MTTLTETILAHPMQTVAATQNPASAGNMGQCARIRRLPMKLMMTAALAAMLLANSAAAESNNFQGVPDQNGKYQGQQGYGQPGNTPTSSSYLPAQRMAWVSKVPRSSIDKNRSYMHQRYGVNWPARLGVGEAPHYFYDEHHFKNNFQKAQTSISDYYRYDGWRHNAMSNNPSLRASPKTGYWADGR